MVASLDTTSPRRNDMAALGKRIAPHNPESEPEAKNLDLAFSI